MMPQHSEPLVGCLLLLQGQHFALISATIVLQVATVFHLQTLQYSKDSTVASAISHSNYDATYNGYLIIE